MQTVAPLGVERTSVQKLVADQIENIRRSSAEAMPLINLYGITGMGKSYALRQLYRSFSDTYATALVQLNRVELNNPPSELAPFSKLFAPLAQLPVFGGTIAPPGDDAAVGVIEHTIQANDGRFVLLLLDGLDDVPNWAWLQDSIITPLVQSGNALVVCSSQSPLNWKDWQVRERCHLEQLKTFDTVDDISGFLEQNDAKHLLALQSSIFDYTSGYPLLVRLLVQKLVETTALKTAEPDETILRSFSDESQRLLQVVGVIRREEADVITELLARSIKENIHTDDIQLLHTELSDGDDNDRQRYLLDPELPGQPPRFSGALRAAVRAKLNEGAYAAICQHLAEIYFRRILEKPRTWNYNYLDWLFFSTELMRLKKLDRSERENQLAKSEWDSQLAEIATALQAANIKAEMPDETLLLRFYQDRELVEQLHEQDLYGETLKQLQARLLVSDANVTLEERYSMPNRVVLEQVRDELYREIFHRLPHNTLPESLRKESTFVIVLKALAETQRDTLPDLNALRRRINREVLMSPRELNTIIDLLLARGLLTETAEKRVYRLNSELVMIAQYAIKRLNDQTRLSVGVNTTL